MAEWQIERLDAIHERGEFCCGKAPLDDFMHSLVNQYEKRKLGRTFVAVVVGEKTVRGCYTLAASSITFASVPARISRKLPKHPVPVVLLGRLAVDRTHQGKGLGEELLMDALHRSLTLSENLGIFAVEVLALDHDARDFYLKYGFVSLLDSELHLFLPLKTIEAELKAEGSE